MQLFLQPIRTIKTFLVGIKLNTSIQIELVGIKPKAINQTHIVRIALFADYSDRNSPKTKNLIQTLIV
jgi:hypothetical protein